MLLLLLLQVPDSVRKFESSHTDSIKYYYTSPAPVPVPQPPPVGAGVGLAVAAWHVPVDSLSPRSNYTGTTINGASDIKSQLDRLAQLKGQTSISVGRSVSQAGGRLSVKAACDDIAKWPDLTPFKANIRVGMASDDIDSKDIWGPGAPYYAQIDSIARCIKIKSPWLPTGVRQAPTKLSSKYKWRWLDDALAQYEGPQRSGTPAQFISNQLAAGKLRGLGVIFGMNYLDGGDGSSNIFGTYEDSKKVNRWQMSGKEISSVGRKLSQVTCFLPGWTYSLNWNGTAPNRTAAQIAGIKGFDKRADVKVGLAEVRAVADTTTFKPCYLRP